MRPSASMPSPPPVSDPDDHYYVAGYTVDDDPYAEPSGVLKNLYGITSTGELAQVEGELAAARTLVFAGIAAVVFDVDLEGEGVAVHRRAVHQVVEYTGC